MMLVASRAWRAAGESTACSAVLRPDCVIVRRLASWWWWMASLLHRRVVERVPLSSPHTLRYLQTADWQLTLSTSEVAIYPIHQQRRSPITESSRITLV